MKVLFVIGSLGCGGAEEQVSLLSRELARRGLRVSVYVLNGAGARIDALTAAGVEVNLDGKRRRLDLGVLGRLCRYLRRWQPDIVHGFKYDGELYARLAACGARVPVLGSERTDNQRVSLIQRIGYRLTSMLCDGVVANTHAGAEYARRLHRLREYEVDVLWNSVDPAHIDARVARSGQPARAIFPGEGLKRLCVVASIQPRNDYPLALRALRRLLDRDPSWRLIGVGEEAARFPGHKAEVLAERDRLGLAPFAAFVGHRSDVVELIASSELLLMTPHHGGFPVVALEAMACGTAVVSTDHGDVRRLLPFPRQVIGSRDEAEIAAALLDCYAQRGEIAQVQRRWVGEHGSASAAAARLLRIYAKYTDVVLTDRAPSPT